MDLKRLELTRHHKSLPAVFKLLGKDLLKNLLIMDQVELIFQR